MLKTQYYKNHLFLSFSRQKSSLPWQPTKILSGSSSYFDEYLKGYLCVKFGAFAKKLTIFSQIRWTKRDLVLWTSNIEAYQFQLYVFFFSYLHRMTCEVVVLRDLVLKHMRVHYSCCYCLFLTSGHRCGRKSWAAVFNILHRCLYDLHQMYRQEEKDR